jgi:hypothetical protein
VHVRRSSIGFRCLYRRLYADGAAVARVEVGLSIRSDYVFENEDLVHLVAGTMQIPVLVDGGRDPVSTRLLNAGEPLARRILRCTTSHASGREPVATQDWWVQAGEPLMLLEYPRGEVASTPSLARAVDVSDQKDFVLSYFVSTFEGRRIGTWLLEFPGLTPRDARRRLRIHLSRLHSEREALRNILRLVAEKRIDIGGRTQKADRLQEYINDEIRLLQQRRRFGFEQEPILAAAYASQNLVDEGTRASLETELERVRRSYARNVRLALDQTTAAAEIYDVSVRESGTIYDYRGATIYDMQKKIEIGDVGEISGFVGFDNVVVGSFNRIESSGAPQETQELLKALGQAIAPLVQSLPEDSAKQVSRDYESFVDEAISPAPRKSILTAVGSGLVDVAQTTSRVGVPVVDLVQKILQLF